MRNVRARALDDFGSLIAASLLETLRRVEPPAAASSTPLTVVCAGRELTGELSDEMDRRAFAEGASWMAIVCTHPRVRIGPVVGAGARWCYACLRRRSLQHHPDPPLQQALLRVCDRDPTWGPQGHLHVNAQLSAAAAARYIADLDDAPGSVPITPTVVWLDLLRHAVARDRVIGVHGCGHCSASTSAGGHRFIERLQQLEVPC